VTKYFLDKGYGFIYGEDKNSYFIHRSQLSNEHIERGYYVSFKPYRNDRSDFNAGNVVVIETPDKTSNNADKKKRFKKRTSSKHKSCNADKVIRPDKEFRKFVKKFMKDKETDNGKTHK